MITPTLPEDVSVTSGRRRDWPTFAPYHYVAAPLGPVAGIWLVRARVGEPVAIVVYGFPGMGCRGRRRVFGPSLAAGQLSERLPRLNTSLRLLHRLVVLPQWRGRGIGPALVAATLPRLGMPWVEALAARPFALIRAGMCDTGPLADGQPHYLFWEHPALRMCRHREA